MLNMATRMEANVQCARRTVNVLLAAVGRGQYVHKVVD